ncbi:MAG TPA: hypothetical protein VEQ66_11090 [Propionibacteriaceae bacterium]|nr:hypothetical protein [Propionibacteriaceae bacterium]
MPRFDVVPFALAWAAVRHRPGGWLLLSLGVALAAFLPVFASGLRTEASVAAIRGAVDALPSTQRAVLAVTSRDLRGTALGEVDASVRAGLGASGLTSVQHTLTFRPVALAGTDVTVGAVDALGDDVRVTSGRLPRSCRPSACEVLVVQSPLSAVAPDLPALQREARLLGLVVTGRAELTDQRLVGTRLVPPGLPMLLGADPQTMSQLRSLTLFGRNTAWYGTLDGGAIAAAGVSGFTRALADVAATVNAVSGPLIVYWPVDEITGAGARADASADRFAVLGAGAGALQLGFCVLVAAAMRRRQQLTARVLSRRGASGGQLLVTTAVQPLLAASLGVVLGVAVATVVLYQRLRSLVEHPAASALAAAGSSWPTLAGLTVAAVLIAVLVAHWPPGAGRGVRQAADAVLVAMVAMTTLLAIGTSGAAAGPFAPSIVVLVSVATGLLAARLWSPLLLSSRLRRLPPRPDLTTVVLRLAVLAGRRRPLLPMVTAGFLAAALCSLVFAGSYRASLLQSAVDQAADQVPLDVRVGPSSQVAVPLDVLDAPKIMAAGPGVAIHPIVSSSVTAFAGSTLATSLPLTGIGTEVLSQMHEFAAVTGADVTAADLAARLRVNRPMDHSAPTLPAGTGRVSVQVAGVTDAVTVSLWLSTPEGREKRLALSGNGPVLSADLRALPGSAADSAYTVRAVEFNESESHLDRRQHGVGEGSTDRALAAGRLRLGEVKADGRPVGWSWTDWGSDQAKVRAADSTTVAVEFRIGDTRVVLAPGTASASLREPLRVAVDPDTAARAGSAGAFGITVNGRTVPARVVAVLPRMPTLGRAFLLADQAEVVSLLDRSAPGTAAVSQVWIAAPGASKDAVRKVLASSSASTAALTYRTDIERAIRTDPVTTRSLTLLVGAGMVALLLAMVSVATAVRSDLEGSAADFFAMELDGVPPRTLRAVLRARSLSTLAVGVPIGVAGGLALAGLATRLLTTGPGGTSVTPPLRLVVAAWPTVAVAAAATLGGLLACVLASGSAFRESQPQPPEVDLR